MYEVDNYVDNTEIPLSNIHTSTWYASCGIMYEAIIARTTHLVPNLFHTLLSCTRYKDTMAYNTSTL